MDRRRRDIAQDGVQPGTTNYIGAILGEKLEIVVVVF
jgi:hypothetical protein